LLKEGWRVFAGRYLSEWQELSALQGEYPEMLHLIPLDVSSMKSINKAATLIKTHTDHLDILINNAGVNALNLHATIHDGQDYEEMHRLYDINTLGALRVVEVFLPLLERGNSKRLCFISSEAASISRAERTSSFGYCMSKAALNMGVKILFNDLHPSGYTFRVYHPGWVRSYMHGEKNMEATFEPEEAATFALPILLGKKEDEDRLILIDYEGKEWPW